MSSIVLIGAGALILFAGIGLGYWFGNSGRKHETEKAGKLQAELDNYRRDVTRHFDETAAHFRSIGKEYRKLYEHMAEGAGKLCDESQSGQALSFAPVEVLAAEEGEPVIADAPADYAPPEEALQEAETDVAAEVVDEPDSEVKLQELAEESTDTELEIADTAEELIAEKTEETSSEKTYH